jgi:hypothetical protein
MKKIKNLSHLREQKAILAARQLQAEKNVRLHWNNLKEELHPSHLAAEAIDRITHLAGAEKTTGKSILKSTFTYGLTLLAHKIADVADEKLKKVLKK